MSTQANDPAEQRQTVEPPELRLSREALARNWGWLLALGIVWIIAGFLAFLLPLAAALAVEVVLAIVFIIGGGAQLVQAWRCRGWRSCLWQGLGGVAGLAAGVLMLVFPAIGIVSLVLVLGAFFFATGVLRIVAAAQNRAVKGWGWMMASGVAGVALGLLLWLAWPFGAPWVLGLLAGVEITFSGWSMVTLALAARRPSLERTPSEAARSSAR